MRIPAMAIAALLVFRADGVTLYELTFDQPAIQRRVEERFPRTQKILTKVTRMKVGDVVLTEPKVHLSEGSDRIGIQLRFSLIPERVLGIQVKPKTGVVESSAKLRYDPVTASFFVEDSQVDELDVDGLGGLGDQFFVNLANLKLPVFLNERPLFKLEGNALKAVGSNLLQEVRVRGGILVAKLGVGEPTPESQQPAKRPVETGDSKVQMFSLGAP